MEPASEIYTVTCESHQLYLNYKPNMSKLHANYKQLPDKYMQKAAIGCKIHATYLLGTCYLYVSCMPTTGKINADNCNM